MESKTPSPGEPPLPMAVFEELVRLLAAPPDELDKAVGMLCARHGQYREQILRHVHGARSTLAADQLDLPPTPATPEQIGSYRILDVLGEGGMGTVFLAEQREPVRRRVALKVIKPGMSSKTVLLRFEAERQALAMMEHGNIARVYEAGMTDSGEPFFAMEYVKGRPITRYCDDHKLSLRDRLELFRGVCAGIQHAHQKGIIHRDLKPGNILVTVQAGNPMSKIIDFGVARATDQRLTAATLHTQLGSIIGTPEYMSPEQAGLDELDIDTRSDVYSLGVLLYELLVGELPLELHHSAIGEMQRRIREDDPPKPSTRLTRQAGATHEIVERRNTTIGALARRLSGDLDWITMKALEKDRTRRYQSAIELAQDIERYLDDLPVLASPPSLAYRTKKFLRRYRGRVIAASAVFVALLAGLVSTTYFWFAEIESSKRARAQTSRADQEAEAAKETLAEFDLLANVVMLRDARVSEQELYPAWPENADAMRRWIVERGRPVERALPVLRAELDGMRDPRVVEASASGRLEVDWRPEFLRDTLTPLVEDIEAFLKPQTGELSQVSERLEWAESIYERSITDHEARWREARLAIRNADGTSASQQYSLGSPLDLGPQLGLVPIGMNPKTGLWEFYHLRSAADPDVIPRHDAEGNIPVTPDTGIIFVLVPGGRFLMGAQNHDPGGQNYDASARANELSVVARELEPYFLARHELTQAQWKRMSNGEQPSELHDGFQNRVMAAAATLAHPVEQVNLARCVELLRRHGLVLPLESQWEYACRAGGNTPWATGTDAESLAGYANLVDRTAAAHMPDWGTPESFDDRFVFHAPVGSYLPNDFGMHDMHGNVWEWCRDDADGGTASLRGGSFSGSATAARASVRLNPAPPTAQQQNLGLRAARAIR